MYNKIAVVCANPWEKFLPVISQGNARGYYEWLYQQALIREVNPRCKEEIELYGDWSAGRKGEMFLEKSEVPQFLYVQGKQEKLLEEVLPAADVVLVGMPGCKEECDKIYLSVLPWKEKSVFLWDGRIDRGEAFFKRIRSEYKLNDKQIIEIKELPSK